MTGMSLFPLYAIIFALTMLLILLSYKNYMQVSGEHLAVIGMAQIIFKALQIAATLIVVYWRSAIFEYALTYSSTWALDTVVLRIGDVFIAIFIVYLLMFIPETFLRIIVSRHKKRDRQSSHLRKILDTTQV